MNYKKLIKKIIVEKQNILIKIADMIEMGKSCTKQEK